MLYVYVCVVWFGNASRCNCCFNLALLVSGVWCLVSSMNFSGGSCSSSTLVSSVVACLDPCKDNYLFELLSPTHEARADDSCDSPFEICINVRVQQSCMFPLSHIRPYCPSHSHSTDKSCHLVVQVNQEDLLSLARRDVKASSASHLSYKQLATSSQAIMCDAEGRSNGYRGGFMSSIYELRAVSTWSTRARLFLLLATYPCLLHKSTCIYSASHQLGNRTGSRALL